MWQFTPKATNQWQIIRRIERCKDTVFYQWKRRWLAFRRPDKCSWGSFSCLTDISGPVGNWYLHSETELSNIIHLWSFVLLSLKRTPLSKWSQPKQEEQLWRRHMLAEERARILIIWREGGKEKEHFYKETWYLKIKKKTSIFIYKPSNTLFQWSSVNPKGTAYSSHLPKPIYLYNRCFVYLTAHPFNQ